MLNCAILDFWAVTCLVVWWIYCVFLFLSLIIFHCEDRKTWIQTVLPCELSLCDSHLKLFCSFVNDCPVRVSHNSLPTLCTASLSLRLPCDTDTLSARNKNLQLHKLLRWKTDARPVIQKDRFSNLSGPLSPLRQIVVIQVFCVCHRE